MVDYKTTQKNRGYAKGSQFSAETEREIGNIWQAGNRISNGYGFWGSLALVITPKLLRKLFHH